MPMMRALEQREKVAVQIRVSTRLGVTHDEELAEHQAGPDDAIDRELRQKLARHHHEVENVERRNQREAQRRQRAQPVVNEAIEIALLRLRIRRQRRHPRQQT
jgi:hypothetical protein